MVHLVSTQSTTSEAPAQLVCTTCGAPATNTDDDCPTCAKLDALALVVKRELLGRIEQVFDAALAEVAADLPDIVFGNPLPEEPFRALALLRTLGGELQYEGPCTALLEATARAAFGLVVNAAADAAADAAEDILEEVNQ